jgi:hypothetical protein
MITGAILAIPILILNFVFTLFPIISMPAGLATALASATTSLYALNSFIPVVTIALLAGILVAVEIAIAMFKFFRFVLSFLPWVGGKGV